MLWSSSFRRILFLVCVLFFFSSASAVTAVGENGENSSKDSTQYYRHKSEFKKNSVRFDLLGKSFGFGFAYDRIVYHKEFDLHLNVGVFPAQLLDPKHHSFNLASYYSSIHKKRWNYVAGLAFTYGIRHTDDPLVTHYTYEFYSAMVGFNVAINHRWDAQLLWTPALSYSREHTDFGFGSDIWMIWYWVGVNVGYIF